MKLFVMPSQQVWYTGIALAGTCLIGAIVVGALHLHEKVRKMKVTTRRVADVELYSLHVGHSTCSKYNSTRGEISYS